MTGGIVGAGGVLGNGGASGVGGATGSGGLGAGGTTGSGGTSGAGGLVRTGGSSGKGGAAGTGGAGGGAGSGATLGMPCTSNRDCPATATCCDGSDPSCDGTRLPAGDGTNAGELVVSADGLTVTDTITGLVWQRDGTGVRGGCSSDDKLTCTWPEAEAYCASLVLGGLSGWRLPGWMELFTILDLTTDWTSAPINRTAFPNTATEEYWTSSPFLGGYLFVAFGGALGSAIVCPDCGFKNRVRCVRGLRCYPKSRFVVVDGGLVQDTLTGLVWQQQGSTSAMTWADALTYCSSFGSGFRLPTVKELDSLVDPTLPTGPSLDMTAFPSTGNKRYWTSSPVGPGGTPSDLAFFGDFSSADSNTCDIGAANATTVDTKLMARCVR